MAVVAAEERLGQSQHLQVNALSPRTRILEPEASALDVRERVVERALDGARERLHFPLERLDLVRRLVGDAPSRIIAGGHIALEHAPSQADTVDGLLSDEFDDVRTRKDLAGRARVTFAKQTSRGDTPHPPLR